MLKSKKCSVENCNYNAFSKGLCQQHLPKKGIKKSRENTVIKNSQKQQIRNEYFEYHISKCKYSEHSKSPINNPSRVNICHIFDKSRHPSLQDHLDNYVYLLHSEHERLDKLLFSLEFEKLEKEFEKTWELICKRIENLLDLCEENTVFTRAIKKYLDERRTKSV